MWIAINTEIEQAIDRATEAREHIAAAIKRATESKTTGGLFVKKELNDIINYLILNDSKMRALLVLIQEDVKTEREASQ